MRLQARCRLRRLAWDRQSETPRYVAKGEFSPYLSNTKYKQGHQYFHRLIMWGRFYKHSPEALVTQILQVQASVWQRSSKLARKLKTAQKILS